MSALVPDVMEINVDGTGKGFTMENIKIHINYLDVYAKQLSQLTNELLGMQDKYDVTAVCPSRFRGQ